MIRLGLQGVCSVAELVAEWIISRDYVISGMYSDFHIAMATPLSNLAVGMALSVHTLR